MDSETFHKLKKFKNKVDLIVKSGKHSHYVLEQFDTIGELFGLSENLLIDNSNEKYYDELSRLFPKKKNIWKQFKPVGSVGKKPFSGDIDLAIDSSAFFPKKEVDPKTLKDWNIDPKQWEATYEKFKKRARTATDSVACGFLSW